MKKTISYLIFAATALAGTTKAQCSFYPAPPDGMVASYYFNGNLVETISNSSAGTVNNGVSYTTDRFGNSNSALNFANTNTTSALTKQYVSLNNPAIFLGDFTIIYWFKTDASQNNRRMYLLSIDSLVTADNLDMELNDASGYWVYWRSQSLPGYWGEAMNTYNDNQWHMAVLRSTGTEVQFYIDMDYKDTYPYSGTVGSNSQTAAGKINLGFNNAIPGSPLGPNYFEPYGFNGQIDDLSMYDTALSLEVLSNYYNNYDLAAWFPFSGGLTDFSGAGNIAQLGNTTSNPSDNPSLTNNRFATANSAYSFNGNGFISVNDFASNPVLGCIDYFSNDFTISFWSRTQQDNKRMYAFSVDSTTTNPFINNLGIEFNDSDNSSPGFWAYWNGSGNPGITEGAMNKYSDNVWHFVTLTNDASTGIVNAFIDTVLVGSDTNSVPVTIGSNILNMCLGANWSPHGIANLNYINFGFVGELDEFKFYRHVLTSTEIGNDYTDPNTAYKSTGIISNNKSVAKANIFPNPGNGVFKVTSSQNIGKIVVTNMIGETIKVAETEGKTAEVDFQQSSPGIYFVTIYDTNRSVISVQKLVKK